MEFFDLKEDVIDLQLTQHGKYLLSRGLWHPKYYSFYDDDVIYDSQFAGFSETQSDAHKRIKSQTIRPKAQYVFTGIETEFQNTINPKTNNTLDQEHFSRQSSLDRNRALTYPLGSIDPTSNDSSAFNIVFAKAHISSSAASYTGSLERQLIPQIEVDHVIKTFVGLTQEELEEEFLAPVHGSHEPYKIETEMERFAERTGQPAALSAISENFEDGSFYYEEQDYVFLDVKEINQMIEQENFEIEVFEFVTNVDKNGLEIESLRQLTFLPTPIEVERYAKENDIGVTFPTPTPENVEYYFFVNTDQEIEDQILCQVNFENKSRDLFSETELEFDCTFYPLIDTTLTYSEAQQGPEDPC